MGDASLFEPAAGTVIFDEENNCLAQVMEVGETKVALRPPRGGREWWTPKDRIREATASDRLRPEVVKSNHIRAMMRLP